MENHKQSKSELLQQLKIDRSHSTETEHLTSKRTLAITIVIALFAALGGAVITYYMLSKQLEASKLALASAQSLASNQTSFSTNKTVSGSDRTMSKIKQSDAILNASGYITARRMATVSAKIMGLIKDVTVEEGMNVTKGQILAKLDDSIASVNLKLALAQIESVRSRQISAKASLAEAQRQQIRIVNNEFSSEAEKTLYQTAVETATANLETISAELKVSKFAAERQQSLLDEHTIRAPFDGVVTIKNAQQGEIVSPSSAGGGFTRTGICTIVDMDSLEIEVDVNESFIGRVYAEQKVEAQLDAYSDWTIPASVIAIIPTADRGKATVKVRIKIDIKDNRILPEMGVKVSFLK